MAIWYHWLGWSFGHFLYIRRTTMIFFNDENAGGDENTDAPVVEENAAPEGDATPETPEVAAE